MGSLLACTGEGHLADLVWLGGTWLKFLRGALPAIIFLSHIRKVAFYTMYVGGNRMA